MQIGWALYNTRFTHTHGVGDDQNSYAYDGERVLKFCGQSSRYGERWTAGDVIGVYINFDDRTISYSRNHRKLGVAFSRIKVGENCAYFPAASVSGGGRLRFNFGTSPFLHNYGNEHKPLQYADSQIQGFVSLASIMMEMLSICMTNLVNISVNSPLQDRLVVASLLWEHMLPMLEDDFVLKRYFLNLVN